MNDFDEHELNRLLDSDDDTFQVGDVVRLKHGTRPMDIIYMYPNRRVVKCEYVHSGVIRTAPVVNLVHVRSNQSNNQEETTMSKYGNQSHDQIFEALVEKQFYTVMVKRNVLSSLTGTKRNSQPLLRTLLRSSLDSPTNSNSPRHRKQ